MTAVPPPTFQRMGPLPRRIHLTPKVNPQIPSAPSLPENRLPLKEVTLWSIVWSADLVLLERTLKVLRHCCNICDFGEVMLFTCLDVPPQEYRLKVVTIDQLDLPGYNLFVNRRLSEFIKTPFAMCVHEDGFPIHPKQWSKEFLDYDFIGAPWPDGVVGNGGFCIESKRLLDMKPSLKEENVASDVLVCRTNRELLESGGIRFAPREVALRFSTEILGNNRPSLGFHGRTACPQKYAEGWRAIEAGLTGRSDVAPGPAPRMSGRICIATAFNRNYMPGGRTLFKSIRRHTDCSGVDFKVITDDPEVVAEFGVKNCHVVTGEIKERYANVKFSKDLPAEKYMTSWYRYEMFNLTGYDRVICIDSDCLCLKDISYLFSEELNRHDLVSVEDHIVSKCFPRYVPHLEAQGLNFKGLQQRMRDGKVDVQPALLVANKSILNYNWYRRLLDYANATDFTYSIDEGILNDFIYLDGLRIKLLPLEWDYQDLYEIHCPELPVPSKPVIVHCQESKPFIKDRAAVDPRMHKWYDRWWSEARFGEARTIVAVIVWNRFANLQRWIRCWNQCDQTGASLVVVHNLESDNAAYWKLCRDNNVKYVPRENLGFDMGAFQDVCKERLDGFPNGWENLIWVTDDCIPMRKDFIAMFLKTLEEGYLPCYEISDEVRRHVRTTGFMVTKNISRKLTFPRDPVATREDCYAFEHKGVSLHDQLLKLGCKPKMVTASLKEAPLWDIGCRASLGLMPAHEIEFPVTTYAQPSLLLPAPSRGVLDDLAIKHKADKSSLYHNFATKYEAILSPFRKVFTSVLEIGVAQGQSLRMWVDYFPGATVHGADISAASEICKSYSNRIQFHLMDQGDETQLKNLERLSPFDLIVDDGNHLWREQILTFKTLFPYLRQGGIYIVEDSCTSYWQGYNNNPISCMEYFKGLTDEVCLRGSRGRPPDNPPADFTDWHKGWHRREDCHSPLPDFDSITFMNAIIVIRRRRLP